MRYLLGLAAVLAVAVATPGRAHALGFGAQVSAVDAKSGPTGSERGVFGRFSLIGPLSGELQLARIDYPGDRSDKRFGVGLHLEILPIGKWMPFLTASTGVIDSTVSSWNGQLVFDEVGGGLAYYLNPRIALELDYRKGHVEKLQGQANTDPVPLAVLPAGGKDDYQQVQLGLSVSF
jgi:hypothetical protein